MRFGGIKINEIDDITRPLEIFFGAFLCLCGGLYAKGSSVLLMFIMTTVVLYAIVYNSDMVTLTNMQAQAHSEDSQSGPLHA